MQRLDAEVTVFSLNLDDTQRLAFQANSPLESILLHPQNFASCAEYATSNHAWFAYRYTRKNKDGYHSSQYKYAVVSCENKDALGAGCYGAVYQSNATIVIDPVSGQAYIKLKAPGKQRIVKIFCRDTENGVGSANNEYNIMSQIATTHVKQPTTYISIPSDPKAKVNTPKRLTSMVSKYEEGVTLTEFVNAFKDQQRKKSKTTSESSYITIKQVLLACRELILQLINIHKLGIAHLDLKPANTIINPLTGEVRYIDYGLSKKEADITPSYNPGTYGYCAKEAVDGSKLSRASDKGSLARILMNMFGLPDNYVYRGNREKKLMKLISFNELENSSLSDMPFLFKNITDDELPRSCKVMLHELILRLNHPIPTSRADDEEMVNRINNIINRYDAVMANPSIEAKPSKRSIFHFFHRKKSIVPVAAAAEPVWVDGMGSERLIAGDAPRNSTIDVPAWTSITVR